MIVELKKIKKAESNQLIEHYLNGKLLSGFGETFLAWTEDEVKEQVFDVKKKRTTWDFSIETDGKGAGILSFRSIDYENRNAIMYITLFDIIEKSEEDVTRIMRECIDFAFHQMDLFRLEGFVTDDRYKKILANLGFAIEAEIEGIDFRGGKRVNRLVYGLLKNEYEEV